MIRKTVVGKYGAKITIEFPDDEMTDAELTRTVRRMQEIVDNFTPEELSDRMKKVAKQLNIEFERIH